jgi:formamidase
VIRFFSTCWLFRTTSLLLFAWTNGYSYRAKAIWDFEGIYCTSRHLPHVKFAGLIHPGILGCAPSAEVSVENGAGSKVMANGLFKRFWQRGISVKENSLQQTS